MKKENKVFLLFLCILVSALVIINIPISEKISIEKSVFEWVQGQRGQAYTLVIDGCITKNIISKQVFFAGDIYIKEISDLKLKDVQMQIRLDRNEIVNLVLIRTGIHEHENENIAINETLGTAYIKGIFNKIIIVFPHEKEAYSLEEISDKKFFAENLEDANEIIYRLKQKVLCNKDCTR